MFVKTKGSSTKKLICQDLNSVSMGAFLHMYTAPPLRTIAHTHDIQRKIVNLNQLNHSTVVAAILHFSLAMSSGSPCSSGTVMMTITSSLHHTHHIKTRTHVQSTSLLISFQGKESPTIATTYSQKNRP